MKLGDTNSIIKLEDFVEKLLIRYKEIKLQKLFKYKDNHHVLVKKQDNIRNQLIENLEQHPFLGQAIKNELKDCESTLVLCSTVPISFFHEETLTNDSFFLPPAQRRLGVHFEEALEKLNVKKINLYFEDNSNLRLLLDEIDATQTQSEIILNSLIYSSQHDRGHYYRKEPELLKELELVEKNIEKIGSIDSDYTFYYDNRFFDFYYEGIKVDFRPPNERELERELNNYKIDKIYQIPIVNDIKEKFTKNEAITYLRSSYYIMEVRVKFEIKTKNPMAALLVKYQFREI